MKKRKTHNRQSLHSYHESQIPKLVGSLFREASNEVEVSSVYAVTSVQHGEGASTISLLVAREFARQPGRKILLASTDDFRQLVPEDLAQPDLCWGREQSSFFRVIASERKPLVGSAWDSDPRFARALIQLLRQHFDAVLVDAGDLLSSHDIARLGHLIDGVVLVVQADRSTKAQIERALQVLSLAGGELKGCVLNRRTYPIPDLIYRWFRS
ncbi:tyrosine-protein kinase family protein [Granulicella sibirica]|uniref:tyrosine-protein kinase family protein n=1 Tax=Granulicella sibirica TaxID=2479048 RepID=UPI001008E4E4|nr:tyrosine-protein kinase family protein [Granulicella sibirica]